jgi:hypothetical protein
MANITDSITNINFLSQEQFNSITAPSNNELYAVEFTPKGFNLFDYKLSNYTLNDPRWLCANNFTWQYSKYIDENYQGYGIAYQHLLEDYNAETTLGAQSETIAGTTVYFRLAADGHKIAPADQETSIQKIYEATGAADYFMIDTTNERFKLPRKQKRQLIATYNNGTNWYNQYSDGWVEQGGKTGNLAWNTSGTTTNVTLPITMKTTTYYVNGTMGMPSASGWHAPGCSAYASSTTTIQIRLAKPSGDAASIAAPVYWEVKGYAASVPTQTQLEYYYVGEYTIPALENIAGINTEILNNKVDITGAQIITGRKTFTSPIHLRGDSTFIKVDNIPAADSKQHLRDIEFIDTAGNRVCVLRGEIAANNRRSIGLNVCSDTNANVGGLTVSCAPDGTDMRVGISGKPIQSWIIASQHPSSANGYRWYRKYSDGWIEQGVSNVDMTSAAYTFTFPVAMKDTTYTVTTGIQDALNTTTMGLKYFNLTTTSLQARNTYQTSGSTLKGSIVVQGMAA